MLDVLVRGGTVIDGTGGPARRADVAIEGDRIREVGLLTRAAAARVIDAAGLIVTPGFVDMHSHADYVLPGLPTADSKVHQGFTLEVVGNCGQSPAPLAEACRQDAMGASGLVLPPLAWDWESFGSYLGRLREQGTSVNVAPLVGHGAVRMLAMGMRAAAPEPAEFRAMESAVRRAMDEGAVGVSTGLIYPPGVYADIAEIIALARVVGRAGGLYASHIRGEGSTLLEAIGEAIEVGRRGDLPVEISHLKASGPPNWPKMARAIELIEAARAEGLDVTADMYPYPAGSTALNALLPDWAHAGGRPALLGRLGDPAERARLRAALDGPGRALETGWDRIVIATYPPHPAYEGRSLEDVAAARRVDPAEALLDLLRDAGGEGEMILHGMSEDNVALGLRQPWVMIGSDGEGRAAEGPYASGKPHPRNYGTVPRFLGHYVRERRLVSLEAAVRKLTGLPAGKLGLPDRGIVRAGAFADLVVFDAERIAETSTFQAPHRYPEGIPWVLVNGEPVVADGRHTGARPGRVVGRR
jgi:N-acyl-D-amino-acid deacylase